MRDVAVTAMLGHKTDSTHITTTAAYRPVAVVSDARAPPFAIMRLVTTKVNMGTDGAAGQDEVDQLR